MGLAHSPRIVTNNLLLNLDFANVKNYDGRENRMSYSEDFSGAWWARTRLSAATVTGIAPPSSLPTSTVWKITEDTSTEQHLLNQWPEDTTVGIIYTFSVYLKAGTRTSVALTGWGEGYSVFNLSNGTITQTGGNVCTMTSVGDGWYRCSATITKTNTNNWFYVIPWNGSNYYTGDGVSYFYITASQVERGSYTNPYVKTTATSTVKRANTVTTTVSSLTLSRTNPSRTYAQYNNGVINFTRAATANNTNKNIAGDNFQVIFTQTNLKPSTFLYNDFTWEVWFKPNDLTPSNYDVTEGTNAIIAFRGWHQGFTFDTGSLNFWVLNNTGGGAWDNISISASEIPIGNWYQAVVTRSGNLYSMYKNGVLKTTSTKSSIVPIPDGSYTSNELHIGGYKYYNAAPTDGYFWHSKMDFACTNMYNRALSAQEIKQNFNALRGRFGI